MRDSVLEGGAGEGVGLGMVGLDEDGWQGREVGVP